jgi:hypothetical protein
MLLVPIQEQRSNLFALKEACPIATRLAMHYASTMFCLLFFGVDIDTVEVNFSDIYELPFELHSSLTY